MLRELRLGKTCEAVRRWRSRSIYHVAAAGVLFGASQAALVLLYCVAAPASRPWANWVAFVVATAALPVLWETAVAKTGLRQIGFRLPRVLIRESAVALVGAGLLIGYVVLTLHLLGQRLPHSLAWDNAGFFALEWAVVALSEETLYRGVLQRRLSACLGPTAGLLLASAVWAFVGHVRAPVVENLLIRFPAGLVLGLLYARSGSLYPPMLAHWILNMAVA